MKKAKYIKELIHYLIDERKKIEDTGLPIDSDLTKIYDYINDGIQSLNQMLFKVDYKEVRDRLVEEYDYSPEIDDWED